MAPDPGSDPLAALQAMALQQVLALQLTLLQILLTLRAPSSASTVPRAFPPPTASTQGGSSASTSSTAAPAAVVISIFDALFTQNLDGKPDATKGVIVDCNVHDSSQVSDCPAQFICSQPELMQASDVGRQPAHLNECNQVSDHQFKCIRPELIHDSDVVKPNSKGDLEHYVHEMRELHRDDPLVLSEVLDEPAWALFLVQQDREQWEECNFQMEFDSAEASLRRISYSDSYFDTVKVTTDVGNAMREILMECDLSANLPRTIKHRTSDTVTRADAYMPSPEVRPLVRASVAEDDLLSASPGALAAVAAPSADI